MTLLQIAVDGMSGEEAIALSDETWDVVDIYEVGTPLLLREGLRVVNTIKQRHPSLCVFADTKIADGGRIECADACRAGADMVSVLAVCDDKDIHGVVDVAQAFGRKVLADLIHVHDQADRAKRLLERGVDLVCVHTAYDLQGQGRTSLGALRALREAVTPIRIAVAGGIKEPSLDTYLAEAPAIIIMGEALCKAPDVRKAVLRAKAHMVR